jgi:hypothetical protein
LKAGLWFRRGRLLMVSPVHGIMPISGRNSTYPECPIFPSQLCSTGLGMVGMRSTQIDPCDQRLLRFSEGEPVAVRRIHPFAHLSVILLAST